METEAKRHRATRTRRYWTSHWKNAHWRTDVNTEGLPLCCSGGNSYRKRRVSEGDRVYIVSLKDGHLLLGGRMTVGEIVSRQAAMRFRGKDLYPAQEWIIDRAKSGTPLDVNRRLAPELSRQLRFVSPNGEPKPLFFVANTNDIDVQATRGVRELTPESASLLDQIIENTDHLPRTGQLITVTEKLLRTGQARANSTTGLLGVAEETYGEGGIQIRLTNRYERDSRARAACLKHYGAICTICKFDFAAVYGKAMLGVIHVHHLSPLSGVRAGYKTDPIRDLRPLCANCHTVVHRRDPPYSIDDVRSFLKACDEGRNGLRPNQPKRGRRLSGPAK